MLFLFKVNRVSGLAVLREGSWNRKNRFGLPQPNQGGRDAVEAEVDDEKVM